MREFELYEFPTYIKEFGYLCNENVDLRLANATVFIQMAERIYKLEKEIEALKTKVGEST